MASHPSISQLELLARRQLDELEAGEVRSHLELCANCRAQYEECEANRAFGGQLREAVENRATVALPDESGLDAIAEAIPAAPSIPGFEMIRELHRGGQGVIYEAVQQATKRKVAIKVLLEGLYASKSAQKRFEREIDLVAQLKHPNIITIFDSGATTDGRRYYVMDYIRGVPLDRYVRDRKLTLEETLALFMSLCDAVGYAHQRGVIHRDLKPSNILVDSAGMLKVLDFGLARQLLGTAEEQVSMTMQVVGTLPYISPEQAQGNPEEIDIRTDVYSLGVILYELLTGQYPYPVTGHMAEVLKHIAETPPDPPSRTWKMDSGVSRRKGRKDTTRQIRCPIDNDIETIVLKSLSKERPRRYQSAGELARDIGHYLAREPIEAKRDSLLYVLKKKAVRHSFATAVLALLAIAVVSNSAVSIVFYQRERKANEALTQSVQGLVESNANLQKLAMGAREAVRRQSFGWFLEEWHGNRSDRAREILIELPANCPEGVAMEFLLDETFTADKLRARLPIGMDYLVYFVEGERAIKAGRLEEAVAAFRLCVGSRGDDWIASSARARLQQLCSRNEPASLEGSR